MKRENLWLHSSKSDKKNVFSFSGYDIGNHFCEFMFDYVSSKEWPFFLADFTLYPNLDQQRHFLSAYIDAQSANENNLNREDLIHHLIKEANYFALASNFFWTLWAINMATSTAIKFGYMVSGKFDQRKKEVSIAFRSMHVFLF